jgi:DNA polymerase III epsilon subunit-like protein
MTATTPTPATVFGSQSNDEPTYAYLDTETTGLDPRLHEVIEAAWAMGPGPVRTVVLPHTLRHADRDALKVNRYFERSLHQLQATGSTRWQSEKARLTRDLTGATLVGANIAFDASFLLKRLGYAPWAYRLLDVEVYGMAVLDLPRIVGLRHLAELLQERGHDIPAPDHTAAGDVTTTRAVHIALRRERAALVQRAAA